MKRRRIRPTPARQPRPFAPVSHRLLVDRYAVEVARFQSRLQRDVRNTGAAFARSEDAQHDATCCDDERWWATLRALSPADLQLCSYDGDPAFERWPPTPEGAP